MSNVQGRTSSIREPRLGRLRIATHGFLGQLHVDTATESGANRRAMIRRKTRAAAREDRS